MTLTKSGDEVGNKVSATNVNGATETGFLRARQIVDATGNPIGGGGVTSPSYGTAVNAKGQQAGLPTYFAFGTAYAGYANATDTLVLSNATTKVLLVTRAQMQIAATAATVMTASFVRRSALNTGGTATNPTAGTADSTNAAASGVLSLYSAAPTLNGTATTVDQITATSSAAGAGTVFGMQSATRTNATLVIDLRQPITVRQNESFAINFGGTGLPAGFAASWAIEWEEA